MTALEPKQRRGSLVRGTRLKPKTLHQIFNPESSTLNPQPPAITPKSRFPSPSAALLPNSPSSSPKSPEFLP